MSFSRLVLSIVSGAVLATALGPLMAHADPAPVTGVLFYDPTCHNCEAVMENVLPPLESQYGDQLQVFKLDVSTIVGFDAWSASAKHFDLAPERKGVPLLVIGDQILSGEDEIAALLPGAIAAGVAAGHLSPPAELGFTEADLTAWEALSDGTHAAAATQPDPVANALAIAVLLGMVLSLAYVAVRLWRGAGVADEPAAGPDWLSYAVPVLAVLGLGVAGYLSYIKAMNSSAICPIGSCDAVQHSEWAQLLGIPVAYLGFLSYVAILVLWVVSAIGEGRLARLASVGVFAAAVIGVLFSIYLTFLEPFVIKEVCVWCLASAVLMTLILLVSARQISISEIRSAVSPSERTQLAQ